MDVIDLPCEGSGALTCRLVVSKLSFKPDHYRYDSYSQDSYKGPWINDGYCDEVIARLCCTADQILKSKKIL